jgi:hypothetical protein
VSSALPLALTKLATLHKGLNIMNRHQLTYIDLYPEPIEREPSGFAIFCGAAVALVALYCVTVFAFSL